MTDEKQISITNLLLDLENPRFKRAATSQQEAIEFMVEEQKEQLIELANDILEFGLNPLERICVTPSGDGRSYKALEGNRRLTVLKLLQNPDILSAERFPKRNKQFKTLSAAVTPGLLGDLNCAVFDDEKEALRWVNLKHTGSNEGRGTVQWESWQKDHFNERVKGKPSIPLQILRFIQGSEHIDPELKEVAEGLPATTLLRVFNAAPIKDALGINTVKGVIHTDLPPAEFAKGVAMIARDLLHPDKDQRLTSRTIDTLQHREEYAEKIRKRSGIDYLSRRPGGVQLSAFADTAPSPAPAKASRTSSKAATSYASARTTLVPKTTKLPIPDTFPRLQRLFTELKTLKITGFPNAAGVLFRVFIEFSVEVYLEKHKPGSASLNLAKKLEATCEHMESEKIVKKNEVKAVKNAVHKPNSILSANTLNAYVHNPHVTPKETELIQTWDDFSVFILRLWENS